MILTPNTRHPLCLLAIVLLGVWLAPRAAAQATESASERALEDARQLYDEGKIVEALTAFQKFESDFKFSVAIPPAIYFQGWCLANLQKYHEAVNTFDRLLAGYPHAAVVPEAILKQAECYRALTNYAKAVQFYHDFEVRYPKQALLPQALLGEAWTLFKQNELSESKNVIQNLRTQFVDDPVISLDALLLLGQVLTAEKNYDDARRVYEQIAARRSDPRTAEGLYLAGEAMCEAKRFEDAITFYRSVPSKDDSLQHVQAQINDLEAQRDTYAGRGAFSTYNLRMGNVRQLQARLKAGPDLHASALFRVANCYQSLGWPQTAIAAYRELLSAYPNDKLTERARFALIQTLAEHQEFDQANAESERFREKYPNSAFATNTVFLQAESLFGSGQFHEALSRFQEAVAITNDPQLLEIADFRMAACHYGLHDLAKARDGFEAFLNRHPVSQMIPEVLFQLGQSDFELSQEASDPKITQADLAGAAKNYEQIRTRFPNCELISAVTFQLGHWYASLAAWDVDKSGKLTTAENFEKAVAAFQEFIKRWPDHRLVPEALYQTAHNQFAQGKFDAAIDAYKRLVEKFRDHDLAASGAYEIADCYAAEKKPVEMTAALRDFVTRYPNHARVANALYAIASQFESEGKPDEALTTYRELISHAAAIPRPTEEVRRAAIAAELHIATILNGHETVGVAVADCVGFLDRLREEPVVVRAMIAQIAVLYRDRNRSDEAYAMLEQLMTHYPKNTNVRIAALTSTIELALAENDTVRAYATALKLLADPEKDRLPSASYVAIGNALLRCERFAQARDAFRESLAHEPDDKRTVSLARLGLGEAVLGLNQLDDAEKLFREVTTTDSGNAPREQAELDLAKVYLARGRNGGPKDANNVRAVDLLNKVMADSQGGSVGEAAYLLGNCFFSFTGDERENKKTALAYYLRAALVTKGPLGEEAAFRTGQCHKVVGNDEAARSAFQAYLRRFPNGQFAGDAKKELESLAALPQQAQAMQ